MRKPKVIEFHCAYEDLRRLGWTRKRARKFLLSLYKKGVTTEQLIHIVRELERQHTPWRERALTKISLN